jgi:CBS domain containing-hemolysin-like protein
MFFKKNDEKEELKNLLVQTRRKEKIKKEQVNVKWICQIAIISFTISFGLSFVSEMAIPNLSVLWGILLTLAFVFVGILFDIVGVGVTGADEKVFHSMNSRQVKGSKVAVLFKKNADKVSSFCCDVIGDICGIVSGASASAVSVGLAVTFNWNLLLVSLTVAAIVASLTIGGKACGKSFAINKSDVILYEFAKIISIFYKG